VLHNHRQCVVLYAFLCLLIFFVSLVPVSSAASTLSLTALQYSYGLCLTDAACVRHFSLQQPPGSTSATVTSASAQVLFEEIMPVALAMRDGSLDDAMAIVEQCAANVTDPACQYVQTMWQGVMRDLSACAHPNQVWISGHGCVCDAGKHCSDDCLGVIISDLWSFVVGLALVGIGLLVGFAWINQHLRALMLFVTQLNDAMTKELYHHQGVYYLYNNLKGNYTPAPMAAVPPPAHSRYTETNGDGTMFL
jgi:hypothetical protein